MHMYVGCVWDMGVHVCVLTSVNEELGVPWHAYGVQRTTSDVSPSHEFCLAWSHQSPRSTFSLPVSVGIINTHTTCRDLCIGSEGSNSANTFPHRAIFLPNIILMLFFLIHKHSCYLLSQQ